jgi:hypothetical protein
VANIIHPDAVHWEIFFEGLPDWVIPLTKVVPRFYTIDQYNDNWDSLIFNYDFNYIWEKVNEVNYRLYIRLSGSLKYDDGINDPLPIPLYVDLSLWIVNKYYRHNVQNQLGY